MIKTAYQCDADGWLMGETVAHQSPLEPGVYHLPAGCVFDEPPAVSEGLTARWVVDRWVSQVMPPPKEVRSPAQILADFLAANPEVAKMIQDVSGALAKSS